LHFQDEKELDLTELMNTVLPKLPMDPSLRGSYLLTKFHNILDSLTNQIWVPAHWLCIDGVQPTIPENPPPVAKEIQKLESIDPAGAMSKKDKGDMAGKPVGSVIRKKNNNWKNNNKKLPVYRKVHKLRNVETVHVKQLATHELSVEQQLYYKEITEACVGSDETRRAVSILPNIYHRLIILN